MPLASEIQSIKKLRLLVYSITGGGKTTLFRTLPGKKLLLVFDPAGLCSLQPEDDIEFETFIPPSINMAISTLKGYTDSEVRYEGSNTYNKFENYFDEKIADNYFSQFDWVGIDSWTTFNELIMDKIGSLNGREGKNPQKEDYGVASDILKRAIRGFTGINTNLFCSSHEVPIQDQLMRTINMGILVPGKLQVKLPLLFSDIYHLRCERIDEDVKYFMDTVKNDVYPLARCSLNLDPTVEITIPKGIKDPTQYGLGKILREKGYYNEKEN